MTPHLVIRWICRSVNYSKSHYILRSHGSGRFQLVGVIPASIFYKSISGRYRPVRVADGPITARYRFIKNAYCNVDMAVDVVTMVVFVFTVIITENIVVLSIKGDLKFTNTHLDTSLYKLQCSIGSLLCNLHYSLKENAIVRRSFKDVKYSEPSLQ